MDLSEILIRHSDQNVSSERNIWTPLRVRSESEWSLLGFHRPFTAKLSPSDSTQNPSGRAEYKQTPLAECGGV